ncbi:Nitrogen permease regulator 3-like protein [Smittium mucronatum]|uniref:Nitrogen permease regulator 3-like protein n=1 Tax=Smittium mucronatum TaxID=133383 RepID=A0A1R0GW01_9FUNG|nr:Nitrogen permease regulator 3-like protein [Smittium mucronatum]
MEDYLLGVFLVTYSSRGYHLPFKYPKSVFDNYRNCSFPESLSTQEENSSLTFAPSFPSSLNNSFLHLIPNDSSSIKDNASLSITSNHSKEKLAPSDPQNTAQGIIHYSFTLPNERILFSFPFSLLDLISETQTKDIHETARASSTSSQPLYPLNESEGIKISTESGSHHNILDKNEADLAQLPLNKQVETSSLSSRNYRKARENKSLFYYKSKKNSDSIERNLGSSSNIDTPIDKQIITFPNSKSANPDKSSLLENKSNATSSLNSRCTSESNSKIFCNVDSTATNPEFSKSRYKIDSLSYINDPNNEVQNSESNLLDPANSINVALNSSISIAPGNSSNSNSKEEKFKTSKASTYQHPSRNNSSSKKHHTPSSSFNWTSSTIYGFEVKLLAQLLSVRPSENYQKFNIGIDDICFLGYPIRDNVYDSFQDKPSDFNNSETQNSEKPPSSRKESLIRFNNPYPDNSWDQFEKSFSGNRKINPSQINSSINLRNSNTNGHNAALSESESAKTSRPHTIRSASPQPPPIVHKPTLVHNSNPNNDPKKYSSMFHVVFLINGNSPLLETHNTRLYNCVLKPLTSALRWEQEQSNYVYSQSLIMRNLYKTAVNEQWSIDTYFDNLFKQSDLANTLRMVYENIKKNQCTHLIVNNNIPISIQLPNTPLLVRKATKFPSAQAWSYFQPNKEFNLSKNPSLLDYSQKLTSADLYTYETFNFISNQESNLKIKKSSFNKSKSGFLGQSTFSSLSRSSKNLKDDPSNTESELFESDQLKNSNSSNMIFDQYFSSRDKQSPILITKPPIISLLETRSNYNIKPTAQLLEYLEIESDLMKNGDQFNTYDSITHLKKNMTNRMDSSFFSESVKVPGFNRSPESSDLGFIAQNYQRILSSDFPIHTAPYPQATNTLVSSGELPPLNMNVYPTIEPYHSLLLLSSPGDILSRINSDPSPSLIRLIKKASPIQPLAELHPLINISFAQICRLCAHLVYWGEARIICPASLKNIYMVGPNMNISEYVQNHELEFSKKFPGYCLPLTLSFLNRHEPFKDCIDAVPVIKGYSPGNSIFSKRASNVHNHLKDGDTYSEFIDGSNFDVSRSTSTYNLQSAHPSVVNTKSLNISDTVKDKRAETPGDSTPDSLAKTNQDLKVTNDSSQILKHPYKDAGSTEIPSQRGDISSQNNLNSKNLNKNESNDGEALYRDMLVYLLKTNIIAQKHAWPILLVPLYVKLGLKEDQHKLLLKKQWRKSKAAKNYFDSDEFLGENFNKNQEQVEFESLTDSEPGNGNNAVDGFLKNYYFSWRPTSGFASASASERSYLFKLMENKPPNHVRWFLDKTIYFNGKHHVDEILFREFLTISQFFHLMKPFKDLVIMTYHY